MSGGIPSWAVSGAKVVCIRAADWLGHLRAEIPGPRKDEVLTITAVGLHEGVAYLGFAEHANGRHGYHIDSFRPLRTAEQDVSEFFLHHLTTPADRQGVDA
jgi:hypothetical protein